MEKNGVKVHFKAELFQKLCYKFAKEKRYDDGWYCQDSFYRLKGYYMLENFTQEIKTD